MTRKTKIERLEAEVQVAATNARTWRTALREERAGSAKLADNLQTEIRKAQRCTEAAVWALVLAQDVCRERDAELRQRDEATLALAD